MGVTTKQQAVGSAEQSRGIYTETRAVGVAQQGRQLKFFFAVLASVLQYVALKGG
jgi:hypothetical protein